MPTTGSSGGGSLCRRIARAGAILRRMLRAIVALVIGLAIGFAAAWLIFDNPFENGAPTQVEIEQAVARRAAKAHATCERATESSERLGLRRDESRRSARDPRARLWPALGCAR
jgi:hypothetical protein